MTKMAYNSSSSEPSFPAAPFHLNFHLPRVASFSSGAPTEDHHAYAAHNNSANMGREEKPHLDIILDAPYLTLKGTGPDVEPTTLSGHVSLYLTEAISIKEITLQFRGKAKIPMPASESLINNSTSITYVVCNHDWSFLEGEKRHSRTLKAGRHFFPFHLEIGGSLPSSISTTALGGATVAYKLRAVASRPGLSRHLQAIAPVHILRSLTHEALEYQQTLEIENTWPEKMMYSIMVPHKAWAAGDTLAAVFKFSPLMKGVFVQSILTSLAETTKVYARSGAQEDRRVVLTARHEIINGKAVEVDGGTGGSNHSRLRHASGSTAHPSSTEAHRGLDEQEDVDDHSNRDVVTFVKMTIPPSGHVLNSSGSLAPNSQSSSPAATSSGFAFTQVSASESPSPLPLSTTIVTPSHSLEPITVSHRIQWSIYLKNRDGHISELRCSLPVVILDGRLLQESREISVPTRRLMLGSAGLGRVGDEWAIGAGDGSGAAVGDTSGEDEELLPPVEADRELPSYPAHVGDRVANMFLPEAVTMRVMNPWVGRVGTTADSPTETGEGGGVEGGPACQSNTAVVSEVTDSPERDLPGLSSNPNSRPSYSGRNSNRNSASNVYHNVNQYTMGRAHLPHEPGVGEATPLDWVNSELLLSLNDEPIRRMTGSAAANGVHSPGVAPPALPYAAPGPSGGSRWGSRGHSRVGSRAGSPERGLVALDGAAPMGTTSRPVSRPPSPSGAAHVSASPGYGYEALPSSGSCSPGQHGHSMKNFFKATMKPFTTLRHPSGKGKERESPPGSAPDSVPHSPLALSRQVSNSTPSPNGQLDRTQSTSALPQQHQSYYNIHPNGAFSNPMKASSVADLARMASNESVNPTSMTGSSSSLQQAHDEHSHGSIHHSRSPLVHSLPSPGPIADLHRPPSPLANSRSQPNSNAAASTSALQASATSSAATGLALLHRALTEVPDYSIASRGFIGGVPPLSSMRGLPSYEEAARHSRREVEVECAAPSSGSSCQPTRGSLLREQVDNSSAGPSTTTATSSSSGKSRRLGTLSDSDIVGRFVRTGVHVPQASAIVAGSSIAAITAVLREEDEDSDDSEGIQMQTRTRRSGLL